MLPSDPSACRNESTPPSGDQARESALPDDIVAMISQHRRERNSALKAGEQTGRWTWPLETWVVSKFALRWVVTLALHPAEAFDVLELWNRAPAPADAKPSPLKICRDCHAANDPGTSECWRCGRRDWRADPASPATKLSDEPSDRAMLMSTRSAFLIVLALAIGGTPIARLVP
jgi:ribosomal protein L40E